MNSRRQNQQSGRYNERNDQYDRYSNSGSYNNNNVPYSRTSGSDSSGDYDRYTGSQQRHREGRQEDREDYYENRGSRSGVRDQNRDYDRDYDYNRPSRFSRNDNSTDYSRDSNYDYYERRPSGQRRDYDDYGSSARYSSRSQRYDNTGYGEGRPSYSSDREEYYVNRTSRGRDFNDYDDYSNYRQGRGTGNYGGYSNTNQGYSQGYGGRGYDEDGYGTSRSDRYEQSGSASPSGRDDLNQRQTNSYTDYSGATMQSQVNSADETLTGAGNDENVISSSPSSAGGTRGRKRRASQNDTNTELQDVSGDNTEI